MKRWFLAVALLLGGYVGLCSADYVILVTNVGEEGAAPGNPMGEGGGGLVRPGRIQQPGRPGVGDRPQPGPEATPPSTYYVTTVLEIKNNVGTSFLRKYDFNDWQNVVDRKAIDSSVHLSARHEWGTTTLWNPTQRTPFPDLNGGAYVCVQSDGKPLKTVAVRFHAERDKVYGGKFSADKVVDLARQALEQGLLKEFTEVMDKLATDDKDNRVAKDYLKVKELLNTPLPKAELPPALRGDVYKKTDSSHFYTLVHSFPSAKAVEVKDRLDLLEENFRTFYYYFALKGISLPLPKERLVVLLANRRKDFLGLREQFASAPLVTDGFFSRHQNLVVLSPDHLDEAYEALETSTRGHWQDTYDRRKILLKPVAVKPVLGQPRLADPAKTANLALDALMLKTMEKQGERAAISHNASRQLVYALGLLPRNVAAPEWVQFGVGSFFETPLGSPWASPTGPNGLHLYHFRQLKKAGKLEGSPTETLRRVVTDHYFHQVGILSRVKALSPEQKALQDKARATSWALTYYLAQDRWEGLKRYYAELARMPRDMELDEEVLLACFARAFDAWDDTEKKVIEDKLKAVAVKWFDRINGLTSESEEVYKMVADKVAELEKEAANPTTLTPTNPGGGDRPGGVPGRPRGPGGRGRGNP
jgi:hypothetical protein